MRAGFHVSIAGSIDKSVDRALALGCNTFQLFTRNPRGWAFSDLSPESIASFKAKLKASGIAPVFDHMPYLPNLAGSNNEFYRKSVATLKAEVRRCHQLGIRYLVTHLGSHLGMGTENGCTRLVSAISEAACGIDSGVMILLENTAGQKNSLGTTFQDLRAIMDDSSCPERIGFCFDTCHAYAAGYDLKGNATEVLDELEEVLGLERLILVHLNDCKGDLGSHLDRHEHLGLGSIGEAGFRSLLNDRRMRNLPLIMETPVDSRRNDRENLLKLFELVGETPPSV